MKRQPCCACCPAGAPGLAELRTHFERAGIARQKWPEGVHAVEEFPRTASGKVKKFVLRRNLAPDIASPAE
ncbi:hypothetical protein ACFYR1_19525 [Streptomyces canus]|uniref:hypothetical protein n=1 Tax=Streptomyces canus TaxID=58343 RepID=UPI00367B8C8B